MSRRRGAGEEVVLTIESVGARGDGIAHHAGRPIYLPFTAPGDRVRAKLGAERGEGQAAELVEVLVPGQRTQPACPHFGACGGCALQHLADVAYDESKESQVAAALARQGVVAAEIAPLRRIPPGTRRRARFAVSRPRAGGVAPVVGFAARASHEIVDMRRCAVLHPAVVALVEPLRRAAPHLWLPGAAGSATVTLSDSGLDLLLDLAAAPDLAALEALADFAAAQDLARLAWRAPGMAEPVPAALRRTPRVVFAGVAVDCPYDAFLQASAEAEAMLVAAVLAGIGEARRVADLFAGLGTFTFALAERAAVHAVEGSKPAVAAMAAAAARAGLAGRVTSEARDLERRPLTVDELAGFDAIVFDPPRAGAKAQSAALAASSVLRLVAVSCNPASFARDARVLVDGGYRLTQVQPIDQFVWSAEIELVALFERATPSQPRK
jgi:23S rRNA (uracil1939-C5)-methyltransferase